ncbi:MAG: hypothetical protein JRI91_16870, partial [Deltaproteobacteria bacterium]|nr:hypothetical protein [Deltaproteobacteria bacterium]
MGKNRQTEKEAALAKPVVSEKEKRRLYNLHLKGKPTAKYFGQDQVLLLTGGPPGAGK